MMKRVNVKSNYMSKNQCQIQKYLTFAKKEDVRDRRIKLDFQEWQERQQVLAV